MALLKNRPLMMAALLFCAVVLLGFFLPFGVLLGLSLASAVMLGLTVFRMTKRGYCYRHLCLLLCSAAILLGGGRASYESYRAHKVQEELIGTRVNAELRVCEISYLSSYSGELLVDVEQINGARGVGRAVLRVEGACPFSVGDRIFGTFVAQSLDYDNYFEGAEYSYLGEGASLILLADDINATTLLESGVGSFASSLSVFRKMLSMRITGAVSGEAGKLLSALLLGDRDVLSPQTVRNFRGIGVSHLLAISGLHLAIIAGILDRILLALSVGRRWRIGVILPVMLFYGFLVGGSYSVLRAMLMLAVFYLSHLLKGEYDSLTALSVTAAVLVAHTPGALFSISFQMTVLSTLGLLSFGQLQGLVSRIFPKKKGVKDLFTSALRVLLSSLILSLAATAFVLPVLWLTFGELSLLTPLSNLMIVPLVTPLLILGILLLALPISPLGFACGILGKLVLGIAKWLSGIHAILSLRHDFVPFILVPLFLCLVAWLIVDIKKYKPLGGIPILLSVIAFAVCLSVAHARGAEQLRVLYRRDGSNEGLVFLQNDTAILCDSSNTSYSQLRADYQLAQSAGATRIEALILTHYHERAVSSLSAFSKSVFLQELWLPTPESEQEAEILLALQNVAGENGFAIRLYPRDAEIDILSGARFSLTKPLYEERSVQPAYAISVAFGQKSLCYHTAALSEFERNSNEQHACDATYLILGAHGPVPHEAISLPSAALQEVAVPNQEALHAISLKDGIKYYFYEEKLGFLLE